MYMEPKEAAVSCSYKGDHKSGIKLSCIADSVVYPITHVHNWEMDMSTAPMPSCGMAHFYRATACNATQGIAVAILSIRLSVGCMYCAKTK